MNSFVYNRISIRTGQQTAKWEPRFFPSPKEEPRQSPEPSEAQRTITFTAALSTPSSEEDSGSRGLSDFENAQEYQGPAEDPTIDRKPSEIGDANNRDSNAKSGADETKMNPPGGSGGAEPSGSTSDPRIDSLITAMEGLFRRLSKDIPNPNEESVTAAAETTTIKDTWTVVDAGIFYPQHGDHAKDDGNGVFYESKHLCFSDVHLWKSRVKESVGANTARASHVVANFSRLLMGDAIAWWEQQVSREEKLVLMQDTVTMSSEPQVIEDAKAINKLLNRVVSQFGIKPTEASDWLVNAKYTQADIKNDVPILRFANQLFSHARAWGDSTDQQLLTKFYMALDPSRCGKEGQVS
ncbi:hypothetical protein F4804DRAFT_339594 [Jackrogersella minutella]|nr:hypothetical protein F4804DRAFT_339594 [Jackrogersella minutella]